MSDIIDFMERMGGDAQLSQASADDLAEVLSASEMAPELQSAMLSRDTQRLEMLLGTAPECVLLTPPGPPDTGPSPMQPAVPPPPPEEIEEADEIKDRLRSAHVAGSQLRRSESLRA